MHEKLFQKLEISQRRNGQLEEKAHKIILDIAAKIYKTTHPNDKVARYWEYYEIDGERVYCRAEYRDSGCEPDLYYPTHLIFNPDQIQPYIDNLIKEKAQKELDLKAIRRQNLLKELENL